MSFYSSNLAALRERNGYFLGDLTRAAESDSTVGVRREEGGDLFATVSGREHVLKRISRLDGADPKVGLYVVNGFGDGSLIRLVLSLSHVEHVLVFEPQIALLKRLWEAEDFSSVLDNPKLRLISGGSEAAIDAALSRYFYEDPFRLTHVFKYAHIVAPGTAELPGNGASYAAFQRLLVKEIEAKLARVKPNEEDAFWGFLNAIENFPEHFVGPSLDDLDGVFAGKPGVLVAAGPSLALSLDLLKRRRDDVVIFSCDAAVKTLVAHGIIPDFVATVERIGASGNFLRGIAELAEVPLLAPAVTPAATLKAYPGPKLYVRAETGFDDWMVGPGRSETLGNIPSVAHLCYAGLRRMGCDPICLLGQDLSYDPGSGASHADGVMFPHEAKPDAPQAAGLAEVTGFDGKPRRTNFLWRHFAQLYGVLIKMNGGRVLNFMPRTHGIPIDMTERVDPTEGFGLLPRGPIDRSVAQERLSRPRSDRQAVLELGRMNLTAWRERLRHFAAESLAAMRGLSATWRDFKPAPNLPEFEAEFARFFADCEARLAALRRHDSNAFDRGFLRLVMNSFLGLRVERARILATPMNFVDRTSALIQVYFKTFNLVHLWSARCAEALKHENAARWRFWPAVSATRNP